MFSEQVVSAVHNLAIGPIRYYEQIDSTNTEAVRWVETGCPDLALVVANEQTAGRGRAGRQWITPAGAALAFSLVLRPDRRQPELSWSNSPESLPRVTALGALAVSGALHSRHDLPAQIKWPNDVLYSGRKLCGVLAEAHWHGNELAAIILGIGINIKPASVPSSDELRFPATCVEWALEESCQATKPVNRSELLQAVLVELLNWRSRVASPEFIRAWESRLAFRNQWVLVSETGNQAGTISNSDVEGQILGLEADGQLRLRNRSGQILTLRSGELRLRPLENPLE
jgi:BirA family transcriptional regulator, biotin operon repressor / biotin---[acetyl-CoA-carboxylase] ligase